MNSSADEAREVIAEERKKVWFEFDLKWLFRLADWLFTEPPRPPLIKKNPKKASSKKS